MIVALAFKAFANASPCLTPFLATSDPSVLMRILAYIRGLPCSSNIFSKKGMLTYMVRSSPSVYGPILKLRQSGCVFGINSREIWHGWHDGMGRPRMSGLLAVAHERTNRTVGHCHLRHGPRLRASVSLEEVRGEISTALVRQHGPGRADSDGRCDPRDHLFISGS